MQRSYEIFLDSLTESVDEQDLTHSMAVLLDAFEIGKFAYLCFDPHNDGRSRLISNYPLEWTSLYLRQDYDTIDPVIGIARRVEEPFCWGNSFPGTATTNAQLRLFEEAAEFGIRSGLTIPIHDRWGDIAAMTFAASEDRPLLLRRADRYERALQLVATTFHIHARRMRSSNLVVDGVRLTHREYECLQWAAKGKSAWEIGQILGITRRTAAFHLENTKRKLEVRTIAQAVARFAASNSIAK